MKNNMQFIRKEDAMFLYFWVNVQRLRQITLLLTKADLMRLIVNVKNIALSLLSNCSLLLNPHIRSRFIWAPKLPSVSCLEPVWLSAFCSSLDLASQLYIKFDGFSFQENDVIPFLHLVFPDLLFSLVVPE